MERGVLYVATDDELVNEAQVAAESVRNSMDGFPIGIVVGGDVDPDGFDEVINLNNPSYGFKDKILGMRESPFEKTLYLDTDTYVNEDVNDLFSLLDRFDLAATHNPNRDLYTNTSLGVPECFPEYNSGVMAFKESLQNDFFDAWEGSYSEDHFGDQPSFRKTLYTQDVQIATIPREYNCLLRYPSHLVKNVKIFHGRLLDIETKGAEKPFELEELIDDVNDGSAHRLYAPGGYQLWPQSSRLARLHRVVNQRGLSGGARAAIAAVRGR